MEKIYVYIASPYSLPKNKEEQNTTKSFRVFNKLYKLGFIPFAPLTAHYINKQFPMSYNEWLGYDLHWLIRCDCVLRLKGKSKGADFEIDSAKTCSIPVFYSIRKLKEYYKDKLK